MGNGQWAMGNARRIIAYFLFAFFFSLFTVYCLLFTAYCAEFFSSYKAVL
ncbi:MAG: hypothetical protein KME30_19820 [Iphinoe sp. HA4291-MV1]|jgi:hypothetical protein|nr:hypothetical protein [Iphinoe sp. HA4291-MV1]